MAREGFLLQKPSKERAALCPQPPAHPYPPPGTELKLTATKPFQILHPSSSDGVQLLCLHQLKAWWTEDLILWTCSTPFLQLQGKKWLGNATEGDLNTGQQWQWHWWESVTWMRFGKNREIPSSQIRLRKHNDTNIVKTHTQTFKKQQKKVFSRT